jgi:peptidoglycan/xylan/chitin deacetylase (PgdA/CDA1 family)
MSEEHRDPTGSPEPCPVLEEPMRVMEFPPTKRRGRSWILAAAVLVLAGLGAVALFAPIPVTIEGATGWVSRTATVADLVAQGRLTAPRGDLLSVAGVVLRVGEGGSPTVQVNGEVATSSTPVALGARVSSAPGQNIVEATKTVTIETTPSVRVLGHGPVESVEEIGVPGRIQIVKGAVSGVVVSKRVISTGQPMVVRREPAYRGAKEVALTFDDGPWPGSTDAVLAELKSAGAKATFFEVGKQVKGRPEISRRVLAAGMEIGDHSYSHKYLAKYPRSVITTEISFGAAAIRSALGITPRWYRPAGGSTNAFVYSEAKRLGLRVVLWTIDPHDYRKPGAKVIARRVLNSVVPGSVVLMHDGGGDRSQTVAALKTILHGLKARGYAMVTLSRLYRLP